MLSIDIKINSNNSIYTKLSAFPSSKNCTLRGVLNYCFCELLYELAVNLTYNAGAVSLKIIDILNPPIAEQKGKKKELLPNIYEKYFKTLYLFLQ